MFAPQDHPAGLIRPVQRAERRLPSKGDFVKRQLAAKFNSPRTKRGHCRLAPNQMRIIDNMSKMTRPDDKAIGLQFLPGRQVNNRVIVNSKARGGGQGGRPPTPRIAPTASRT